MRVSLKLRIPVVAITAMLAACSPVPREATSPATLRDTDPASLLRIHAGSPGRTFVALHDNENEAAMSARAFVDAHGGRLVEVQAQGTRHIALRRDGRRITFDPNRVFTDAGRRRTLVEQGAAVDLAAIAAARSFAMAVLHAIDLDTTPLLVAVHNNTDAAYSAASYAAGAALAGDAAAVHLPPGADPDDFFLVTTRALFDALRPTGYPVVLQDNARAADDGSLSILCGRRGIGYVNVEAQHGHADVQHAMLDALDHALSNAPDHAPSRVSAPARR